MLRKILLLALSLSLFAAGCKSTKDKKPEVQTQPEPAKEQTVEDDEFNRSTAGIDITREEFNADKNEILQIIGKLSKIMADYDYDAWLKYIDPDSVAYWSTPKNLLSASKRLPAKIRLTSLNDYFRYVFVPSRKGRAVEEIRYISRDSVKAVQVKEDRDIVYYNFVRVDGKWMVNIPELHE